MADILSSLRHKLGFKTKGNEAWGLVDGLGIRVHSNHDALHTLIATVSVVVNGEKADEALEALKASGQLSGWRREGGRLAVVITSLLPGWTCDLPAESLKALASALLRTGARPACSYCGEAANEGFLIRGGEPVVLCGPCRDNLPYSYAALAGDKAGHPATSQVNYSKGTAGALLGSAIGIIIWVLWSAMSDFPILAGAAISFFTGRGFMLAAKRIDRNSAWISWGISLAAFISALFLSRDVLFMLDRIQSGQVMNVAQVFADTFRIAFAGSASPGQFIKDGLFGLLFLALGALDFANMLTDNGIGFFRKL